MAILPLVFAFLLGAVGWTLAEYLLHRFLMHAMRGRGMASREHLTHHARRDYFASAFDKGLFCFVVTLIMIPLVTAAVGWPIAVALQVGFVGAYLTYEWIHRSAHTHPPTNTYGRWLRRHHFHHHFGRPLENHGVSSPVWDKVFGTDVSPGVIRVPRRMAMRWLLTPDGELDPRYAADYVLVGSGPIGAAAVTERLPPEVVDLDTRAAFSNVPPPEAP